VPAAIVFVATTGRTWPRPSGSTTRRSGYLERGEYNPSLYLALRIANHFEVPVEVVFSLAPFPGWVAAEDERS
jgi:hypothetical protein